MRVEISGDRILMVVEGLWNDAQLAETAAEFHAAVQGFACAGKPFDTLSDFSAFAVQQQPVAEGLRTLIDYANEHGLRRSANVVSGGLLRLQMRRLFDNNPRYQVFEDTTSAIAWLEQPI